MGVRRWILTDRTVVRENLLWEDTSGLFFRASPDEDYPRVNFRCILVLCHHSLCCNLCVTQKGICTNIYLSDVIFVQHLNNGSGFFCCCLNYFCGVHGPLNCVACTLLKPSTLITQREGGTANCKTGREAKTLSLRGATGLRGRQILPLFPTHMTKARPSSPAAHNQNHLSRLVDRSCTVLSLCLASLGPRPLKP